MNGKKEIFREEDTQDISSYLRNVRHINKKFKGIYDSTATISENAYIWLGHFEYKEKPSVKDFSSHLNKLIEHIYKRFRVFSMPILEYQPARNYSPSLYVLLTGSIEKETLTKIWETITKNNGILKYVKGIRGEVSNKLNYLLVVNRKTDGEKVCVKYPPVGYEDYGFENVCLKRFMDHYRKNGQIDLKTIRVKKGPELLCEITVKRADLQINIVPGKHQELFYENFFDFISDYERKNYSFRKWKDPNAKFKRFLNVNGRRGLKLYLKLEGEFNIDKDKIIIDALGKLKRKGGDVIEYQAFKNDKVFLDLNDYEIY